VKHVWIYAIAFFLIFPSGNFGMAEVEDIPEWGVYVYMAGDNSLYEEVEDDLNEMKMVGSNEDLEIVVLTDQNLDDDSHAYHVIKHGLEEIPLNEINSNWNNELDMGNGETLRDFMIWASSEYPAKRKVLVIWNHGSGWEKVAEDKSSYLDVPEIRESLEDYRTVTGEPKLTMIGFDACLMGMFEIAYELKDQAEMIHGSEAYEPLEGWTYNHLLYKLKKETTNEQFAHNVVNDYIESYRNGSVYTSYSVTASVVDTNKLEELWNSLDNLSSEIKSVLPVYYDEINTAREETQRYDQNPNYRDLYDFAINLEKYVPVTDVQAEAKRLRNILELTVIAEDHWQKPEKLNVDRAHGLTIYFPKNGADSGYSDLTIHNNKWFEFIENFQNQINPDSFFTGLNVESIDTGTGYNDSVMINGSYSGNASNIKIRLINSESTVTNKYNGEISNGVIDNITLQPTKSGNYSLEIGIYNSDKFLEDHYINENIFINLQLPDLAVMSPKILVTMENGTTYEVQNVQEGDNFSIKGEIQNIGTVKSNNVTVLVNMSSLSTSIESIFNYDRILPGQNKEWSLNITDSLISGEIQLQVSTYSTDTFEIDSGNNYTVKSLHVFPFNKDNPIPYEYNLVSENRNILEIQTNNEVNYEFSWLETYLIITNTNEQPWDFINLEPTLLEGWKFESEKILHLNDESISLIRLKPPLNTEAKEYKVNINLIDRNGEFAGNGEITVNVPQYYGIGIKAEQNNQKLNLIIQNTGNGNDIFTLNKELEEGLDLYLTETYFELEPFEEKTIQGIGIEMNNSKYYTAKFTVQSIGNANISAEISIDIENKRDEISEQNNLISASLAIIGIIGLVYILYNRRLS
jgi:dUTPase